MTIYDEMDDRPSPEDERAEAWEYWHERGAILAFCFADYAMACAFNPEREP